MTEAGGITDVGAPESCRPASRARAGSRNDDRLGQERRHRPAPAFYLLLGMAIAALATATLPASAVPSPWLGATLAVAQSSLAGTMALVAVIVAYLLTVGT